MKNWRKLAGQNQCTCEKCLNSAKRVLKLTYQLKNETFRRVMYFAGHGEKAYREAERFQECHEIKPLITYMSLTRQVITLPEWAAFKSGQKSLKNS